MKKLSIIIPVYNVEPWVARCLESCINQEIPIDEYEIIVVNDGTKDNSMERVKEVQKVQIVQDGETNIRIVNRENGGLSSARNAGLSEAKGEYVWFVDSDDWIEPHSIRALLEDAILCKLDIMCFNRKKVFEDYSTLPTINPSMIGNRILTGEEFLSQQPMLVVAWLAFFRRMFLLDNNLRFREGILHEDQEFTPRAYFLANSISYRDICIYNYFQRNGSIMNSSQNAKRANSYLEICDSLFNFCNEHVLKESSAYFFFMNRIFFCYTQILAFWSPSSNITLKQLRARPYYPFHHNNKVPHNERMKMKIINFSILLYITTRAMIKRVITLC